MIKAIDKQIIQQRELLIEECNEMTKDSLRITKEWEIVDAEIDWEWNEG